MSSQRRICHRHISIIFFVVLSNAISTHAQGSALFDRVNTFCGRGSTPQPAPTMAPSISAEPSIAPSSEPTMSPSISSAPSKKPSTSPSISPEPSSEPTMAPSISLTPSTTPSTLPTISAEPSSEPSVSVAPSTLPSSQPSVSMQPSQSPQPSVSSQPSISAQPSLKPSLQPSEAPSRSMAPTPFSLCNKENSFETCETDGDPCGVNGLCIRTVEGYPICATDSTATLCKTSSDCDVGEQCFNGISKCQGSSFCVVELLA